MTSTFLSTCFFLANTFLAALSVIFMVFSVADFLPLDFFLDPVLLFVPFFGLADDFLTLPETFLFFAYSLVFIFFDFDSLAAG
jgi:hypothetical protein